jgi:hypothetical protein
MRLAQETGAQQERQCALADLLRETTQPPDLCGRELEAGHLDVLHLNSGEGFLWDRGVHAVSFAQLSQS